MECPCGSIINHKENIGQHKRSAKHKQFEKDGIRIVLNKNKYKSIVNDTASNPRNSSVSAVF